MKNENGITLVSLVVTIIIMLILATVSIGTIKTGLIDKAKSAKTQAEKSLVKEKVDMAISECEFEYFNSNNDNILEYLHQNLNKYLSEFNNVNLELNSENILLTFEYNDAEYSFIISPNGTSNYGKSLTGNVKVGEFINYPITYIDVISEDEFGPNNGWTVIDDGKMNGTSGNIKIMSYGVPGKILFNSFEEEDINDFVSNFKNEKMTCSDGTKKVLSEMLVENIATNVSPLTLNELNNAYNELYKANRGYDDITGDISNGNDMFCNQLTSMYWLFNNGKLLMVANKTIMNNSYSNRMRSGVKIIITLKSDLNGNFENGVWKINN